MKYVVRHYDWSDNNWLTITEPLDREEAKKVWNEKTKNGEYQTKFADGDYYQIFEADTTMLRSAVQ